MIHTEQLTRHFVSKKETVEAVKGVDIDVAAGELVAFLGPNGAGKSTTLRMLTTLLPPTSGERWVAGASITDEPAAGPRRGSATSARATAPGTASGCSTSWSARAGSTG